MAMAQIVFLVRRKKQFINFDEISEKDFVKYYRSLNMDSYFESTKKLLSEYFWT